MWRHKATMSKMGLYHYSDVIMSVKALQITGISIVCSTICSGADHRKHQSSASLAFVRGIHPSPVDSPHEGLVTWKMFPFDDVIMILSGSPVYISSNDARSDLHDKITVQAISGDIFKLIFLLHFYSNFTEICHRWSNNNNKPALIQIMARHQQMT